MEKKIGGTEIQDRDFFFFYFLSLALWQALSLRLGLDLGLVVMGEKIKRDANEVI